MENLCHIERRLSVIAYEDIGLGNPAAVARTIQAIDTAKKVGFPEGRIPLAVAVIDLALSPKSKSAEQAIDRAIDMVRTTSYDIPTYLKLTNSLDFDDKYDFLLKYNSLYNYYRHFFFHMSDFSKLKVLLMQLKLQELQNMYIF